MRSDNSRYIVQAARDRHQATLTRAREALQRLDHAGEPITFNNVARAANVSRAWLYREPQLRDKIDRLRHDRPPSNRLGPPAAQQASDESQQRRIEALLADNKRLRIELRQLHDHLAILLGEQRAKR